MIEPKGVCNLAEYIAKKFKITCGTKVLQFASICFDASVYEWVGTLTAGGVLVLLSKDEMPPHENIGYVLESKKINVAINVAMLTPSIIKSIDENKLTFLQTLVAGAEVCTQDIVDKWADQLLFINAYGPTEITVVCSMCGVMQRT